MPAVITRDEFGSTSSGQNVSRYTLKNSNGVTIKIIDYGGIITSIEVPDKTGKFDDVTPGFDTLAEYEKNPACFGQIVGRVANRIHGGKFTLDGTEYQLTLNEEPNHLHGGFVNFGKTVWNAAVDDGTLVLTLVSSDGDEGYPGTLRVTVVYELTDDNELVVQFSAAVDDKPTIVNLTSHAYFNLAGHSAGDILDHRIMVCADAYLRKTDAGIPTGEVCPVEGTAFDLRSSVSLGECIQQADVAPDVANGYDHTFCLLPVATGAAATVAGAAAGVRHAARLFHRASGRIMDVSDRKSVV